MEPCKDEQGPERGPCQTEEGGFHEATPG